MLLNINVIYIIFQSIKKSIFNVNAIMDAYFLIIRRVIFILFLLLQLCIYVFPHKYIIFIYLFIIYFNLHHYFNLYLIIFIYIIHIIFLK